MNKLLFPLYHLHDFRDLASFISSLILQILSKMKALYPGPVSHADVRLEH